MKLRKSPSPISNLQKSNPTQLAALLGQKKKVAQIRKTDENPPRISIIDVIATINGKDKNQAAEDLRRISTGHPEVKAICFDFKFPGRRG